MVAMSMAPPHDPRFTADWSVAQQPAPSVADGLRLIGAVDAINCRPIAIVRNPSRDNQRLCCVDRLNWLRITDIHRQSFDSVLLQKRHTEYCGFITSFRACGLIHGHRHLHRRMDVAADSDRGRPAVIAADKTSLIGIDMADWLAENVLTRR
jgi:hypothetical protein